MSINIDIIAQGANPPAETTPPFLTNLFPVPLSVDQPRNTNISFTANDTDSGIDIDTITVTITQGIGSPVVAILNGVFQAGFSGSIIPVGINADVVINPNALLIDFDTVVIQATVSDLAAEPNQHQESWSFTTADENPPFVTSRVPSPNTFGNPIDTNISFTVDDSGTGVDLTSAVITISQNGTPTVAYDGGAGGFQPGFQGPASMTIAVGLGFAFVIDPDADLANGTIQINTEVDDLAASPNHLSETYAWSTLEGLGVNKYRVATPDNFTDNEINAFMLYSKTFVEDDIKAIGQKGMVALDSNQYGAYEIPALGRLFQSIEIIDPGGNNVGFQVSNGGAGSFGGATFVSGYCPRRDSLLASDEAEQFISFLIAQDDIASIPFENAAATTYHCGLAFSLKPAEALQNPRTGQSDYTKFEAILGWKLKPSLVTDNFNGTITLRIPKSATVLGARTRAGRTATAFLTDGPAPQTFTIDAIKSATIVDSAGDDEITIAQLGQASPPSTDVNDYSIIVEGPVITESEIRPGLGGGAEFGIAYLGSIVGVTKVIDHDLQAITPNAHIMLRDIAEFTEQSTNSVNTRALKVVVRAKTDESGVFQMEVRDSVGTTVFSVDEAGNLVAAGIASSPAVNLHLTNDDGALIRHFASDIRDTTLGQSLQVTIDGIAGFTGGINWADGTTNPAITVDAQLQKILTDLAEVATFQGARKISAEAVAGGFDALSDGTLQSQLSDLLSFVNTKLDFDGSVAFTGDFLKDTVGAQDLGATGINGQWDAHLNTVIMYNLLLMNSGVDMLPAASLANDIGSEILPFENMYAGTGRFDELRPRTGVDVRCEDLLPITDNTYVLGLAAGFRWLSTAAVAATFNQTSAGDLTVGQLVSDMIPDLGGASHRSIGTITPPLGVPNFADPRPNVYADTLQSNAFIGHNVFGLGIPSDLDLLRTYHRGLQVRAVGRINGITNSITGLHFNLASVSSPSAGRYEITLDLGEDNITFPSVQYIAWFTVGPQTLSSTEEWTHHYNFPSFTQIDVQFNLAGVATDPSNFIFCLMMLT